MVEAGRLALTTDVIAGSPAKDQILLGAAHLWCRDLGAATVRAIGGRVDRSAVTVVQHFGSAIHLHAQVIRREWDLLRREWYEAPADEAWAFLADHARELAAVDRVLLRLPALVHAAVIGPTLDAAAGTRAERTPPLYLTAAQAVSATPVEAVLAQVRSFGFPAVPSVVAAVA